MGQKITKEVKGQVTFTEEYILLSKKLEEVKKLNLDINTKIDTLMNRSNTLSSNEIKKDCEKNPTPAYNTRSKAKKKSVINKEKQMIIYVDAENKSSPTELVKIITERLQDIMKNNTVDNKFIVNIKLYNRWSINGCSKQYANIHQHFNEFTKQDHEIQIERVDVKLQGKNAVDFKICSDISENIKSYNNTSLILCSNDNDFETIMNVINEKMDNKIILWQSKQKKQSKKKQQSKQQPKQQSKQQPKQQSKQQPKQQPKQPNQSKKKKQITEQPLQPKKQTVQPNQQKQSKKSKK
jgi:hypothetical protein